jgi:lipid-binding SYLF domain-containing protein
LTGIDGGGIVLPKEHAMSMTMIRATLAAAFIAVTGCTTAPQLASERAALEAQCAATVEKFKAVVSPARAKLLQAAKGYAVFPTVGKGGAGIGGSYGRGVLYVGGKPVGYCALSQATIGFQLGGQAFSEIVFLETDQMVKRFQGGSVEFSAQASAVAAKAGATAANDYQNGVAVFVLEERGLMYEAAIGGQSFSYQDR